MALSGELKDFGLLQLLTLVQVTSKTGSLTLHRSGESATVFFESGQLVGVRLPDSRSPSLLTALHRAGKIDRDQYELMGSQAPPSEKAVALLLEDQGSLSREDLEEFVRERTLTNLYSLVTWPDGNFRLDVGVAVPEEDVTVPIDLAPVLQKGQSFLDEWQLLASYIPNLERPLRVLPEPVQAVEEVSMSPGEWRLVASLAADVPLKEVAQRLGLDEFGIRRVAYRLISAGLAEIPEPVLLPSIQLDEPKDVEQAKSGALSRLFGGRRR